MYKQACEFEKLRNKHNFDEELAWNELRIITAEQVQVVSLNQFDNPSSLNVLRGRGQKTRQASKLNGRISKQVTKPRASRSSPSCNVFTRSMAMRSQTFGSECCTTIQLSKNSAFTRSTVVFDEERVTHTHSSTMLTVHLFSVSQRVLRVVVILPIGRHHLKPSSQLGYFLS